MSAPTSRSFRNTFAKMSAAYTPLQGAEAEEQPATAAPSPAPPAAAEAGPAEGGEALANADVEAPADAGALPAGGAGDELPEPHDSEAGIAAARAERQGAAPSGQIETSPAPDDAGASEPPTASSERDALVDKEEESADGVGRDAVPGEGATDKHVKKDKNDKKPCCARCKLCCFNLREYKVRGFRLPELLNLLGSLVLPTSDAWLDWSVIIKWYLDGDVHWFEAGLTINLVSGAVSGLGLALMLKLSSKVERIASYWKAIPLWLLVGIPGLAPVAFAAFALYAKGEVLDGPLGAQGGPVFLKLFKGAELAFEALPQSILQCVSVALFPCLALSLTPPAAQILRRRGLRQVRPLLADLQLPAPGLRRRLAARRRIHCLLLRGGVSQFAFRRCWKWSWHG